METFFLTTAIDYVNGRPHLGHAYEKILADVIARYQRSLKKDVFFLTGVDEHGQKVQQSARAQGVSPASFCDEMSGYFRDAWRTLNITHDRFVRTTEVSHKDAVRASLQKLHDKGEIYFQEHTGFYSLRQEQFVTEKDRVDGQWPEIYGDVVETKEPNYFFKLSKYQGWLISFLNDNPDFIYPSFRRNELLSALEKPLNDLCISRPKSRLEWGIPLPFDDGYVTYVWFDALLNYATFAGWGTEQNSWPADLQIIGKDILIPAHGVYWTIMLHALDLPLPRKMLVHGWWQMDGEKMSKSTGKSVDPLALVTQYGADAFRYYVMREMVVGQDADFSVEQFEQRYKSDLGNDLGNLVNRSISMAHRYCGGIVPDAPIHSDIAVQIQSTLAEYREKMDRYEIHQALERVWRLTRRANQFVEEQAPWKLAKDSSQSAKLAQVLATLLETVRVLAILAAPILPDTTAKINVQLGLGAASFNMDQVEGAASLAGTSLGQPEPLFPRL